MSITKVFNSQFQEFIKDVLLVFPNDVNIKTAKFYTTKLIGVNPSLLIKKWHEYVAIPYKTEIDEGDFSFFLSKDYKKDIGVSSKYNSENVMGAITAIKEKAQSMSDDNKTKIVKYLQNLTKLSIMYMDT